jgi:HSP20 family protein
MRLDQETNQTGELQMTFYAYALPHRMARRWMAGEYQHGPRHLPVDVRDEGEAFVLTASTPGLRAEDLKIQVLEDVVLVQGEFAPDENEYLLHELPQGAFRRELRLPAALEADKVEAKIADGILTLRLPKAESARPRTIKVSAK